MGLSEILALLGGVALFLFGMSLMGDSLKKVAGNKLELVLYRLSSTPLKGILLGTGVTAVIQSSSATSVMVVGFVNSGMMKVRQAIGVVMGAIIGTSITGWIICLSDISSGASGWLEMLSTETLSSIMALIGIVFYMFSNEQSKKHIGGILLGFAVLMFGMKTMSGSVAGLKSNEAFINIVTDFSNPLLGILVGILFTSVLQSASAAVGILQALSTTGAMTFEVAFPVIMGIAIGAAVPVLMSALGASAAGKRTAVSYLAIDTLGVILVSAIFYTVNAFSPFAFMTTTLNTVSIALVNTLLRAVMVIMLAPFIRFLEKLVSFVVKDDPRHEEELRDMDRLEDRFIAHPALAIEQSRLVVNSMAQKTKENLLDAFELLRSFSKESFQNVVDDENTIDRYEDKIGTYLVKLTRKELSKEQNEAVTKYLHTITDFERMSDHALNVAESAQELADKGIVFSPEGQHEFDVLTAAIKDIVDLSVNAFVSDSIETAYRIEPLEEVIDGLCDELKLHHIDRVQKGICTLQNGFVYNDLLTNFERVADHCSNIGVAMIELSSDSFDVHEYTNSLLEVRNHSFDEYYSEYENKYKI